MEFRKLDNWV